MKEEDAAAWKDQLTVYGLDLRSLPMVEDFCRWLQGTHPYLDGIINNACQTIRRPPAYYAHLLEAEKRMHLPQTATMKMVC